MPKLAEQTNKRRLVYKPSLPGSRRRRISRELTVHVQNGRYVIDDIPTEPEGTILRLPIRASQQSPARQLARELLALHQAGREQEAIDLVFERLDGWMREGHSDWIDELLPHLPTETLAPSVLVAVLSVIRPVQDQLPNRAAFLRDSERAMTDALGAERTQRLLRSRR